MKINLKITFVLLELVLIPVFFIMFVTYSNARQRLSSEILGQLDTIAQIQKHRAEDFLADRADLIAATTNNADLRSNFISYTSNPNATNTALLQGTLLSIQASESGYQEVDIVNASGTVIAATNPNAIGTNEATSTFFMIGETRDDASTLFNEAGGTGEYFVGPLVWNGVTNGVLVIKSDTTALANLFQDK